MKLLLNDAPVLLNLLAAGLALPKSRLLLIGNSPFVLWYATKLRNFATLPPVKWCR